MKTLLGSLFLAFACTLHAADDLWLTNVEEAKAKAAAEQKMMLLHFTGSDWCSYCIQLEKEVFQTEAFRSAMKDKLVLVTIDFPEDSSKISPETAQQNAALQEKYQIDGYPSILLTDASGQPFASTGYLAGGAEPYITHLQTWLAKKTAFDAMVAEAGTREGVKRAEQLGAALDSLGLPIRMLTSFYDDTLGDIETLDPDATTAFHKELKITKRFLATEKAVEALIEGGQHEEAIALVDKGIADESYHIDQRQRMSFFKTVVLMESGQPQRALSALEACRQLAPDSELSQGLDVLKSHIESLEQETVVTPSATTGDTPAAASEEPSTSPPPAQP